MLAESVAEANIKAKSTAHSRCVYHVCVPRHSGQYGVDCVEHAVMGTKFLAAQHNQVGDYRRMMTLCVSGVACKRSMRNDV